MPRLWYVSLADGSPWARAFGDIVRELIHEATLPLDRDDCYRALMDLWWFLTPAERDRVMADEIRWHGPERLVRLRYSAPPSP